MVQCYSSPSLSNRSQCRPISEPTVFRSAEQPALLISCIFVSSSVRMDSSHCYLLEILFTPREHRLCLRDEKKKPTPHPCSPLGQPFFPPAVLKQSLPTYPHTFTQMRFSEGYLPTVEKEIFWISILIPFLTRLSCGEESELQLEEEALRDRAGT